MTDPTSAAAPGCHVVDVVRRFSDLDALGHVNNVRYLDYLEEGLEGWSVSHGVPRAAMTPLAYRVGFAQPMLWSRSRAEVRTAVVGIEGDVVQLAQEVRSGRDGDRPGSPAAVHLRSETWLRLTEADALRELSGLADASRAHPWRDVGVADGPHRHAAPVTVRSRDVGADGLVRSDAVVEYFQEGRVAYFADLHTRGEDWAMVVLARSDVELLGEVRADDVAVEVRSRIAHLGRSSFTIQADLVVDDARRATSTVVAVCVGTEDQRPVPVPPAQRARLERELAGSAG